MRQKKVEQMGRTQTDSKNFVAVAAGEQRISWWVVEDSA